MSKIRVAQWGGDQVCYLPLYVSRDAGFFAAEGLDVSIYSAGNDDAIFAEVENGKAMFGVGDPSFVAIGAERGADARVVAALITKVCMWGVTYHPEIEEIRETYGLAGLRVACYPRPSTTYVLTSALKTRGGRELKSMSIVESEIGTQLSMLAQGKADVTIEIEPMVSLAQAQGLRVVMSLIDFYPNFFMTGIMTAQETVATKPEIVQKFVTAIQRGLTYCRANQQGALNVACQLFPAISRDVMQASLNRMIQAQAWPEQVIMPVSGWSAALELRRSTGELRSAANFQELLDQRFAFKAAVMGT